VTTSDKKRPIQVTGLGFRSSGKRARPVQHVVRITLLAELLQPTRRVCSKSAWSVLLAAAKSRDAAPEIDWRRRGGELFQLGIDSGHLLGATGDACGIEHKLAVQGRECTCAHVVGDSTAEMT
jgi:hypothetical protein